MKLQHGTVQPAHVHAIHRRNGFSRNRLWLESFVDISRQQVLGLLEIVVVFLAQGRSLVNLGADQVHSFLGEEKSWFPRLLG